MKEEPKIVFEQVDWHKVPAKARLMEDLKEDLSIILKCKPNEVFKRLEKLTKTLGEVEARIIEWQKKSQVDDES